MKGELLIVDDEKEICEMLFRNFKFLGYSVTIAENGAEALKILNKQKVDVLISDILMPELTGVELLQIVRSEYPMVRVIMITGYVTLTNALDCMQFQADAVVFKPLSDLKELENEVEISFTALNKWKQKLRDLQELKPKKIK